MDLDHRGVGLSGYVSRDASLVAMSQGLRVLHLGCVGFTDCSVDEKIALASRSLHQRLTDATECVGVDLDEVTVEELQARGIFRNVIVGDAERLGDLPRSLGKFDLVVAGDIIEHVSNPGAMLQGVRRWLKPRGRLAVSTPNAFGLPNYLRFVAGRYSEGLQHVMNFNAITLTQLLERNGFHVLEKWSCYQESAAETGGLPFVVLRSLLRAQPRFGGTLLFVACPSDQCG